MSVNPNSAPLPHMPAGDIARWTRLFAGATLPILTETAESLSELDPEDDRLDAHALVQRVHRDPFAALKVYRAVVAAGPMREFNVIETLTASTVMLGVPRLLAVLREAPTIDTFLQDAAARDGLMSVVSRACRNSLPTSPMIGTGSTCGCGT